MHIGGLPRRLFFAKVMIIYIMNKKNQSKNKRKITFSIFGFGNMGQAIFKLLKNSPHFKDSANFLIFDTKPVKGIKTAESVEILFKKSRIVFLCVKPQDFYKFNHFRNERTAKTISLRSNCDDL